MKFKVKKSFMENLESFGDRELIDDTDCNCFGKGNQANKEELARTMQSV